MQPSSLIAALAVFTGLLFLTTVSASAQNARLRGFVTDASSGRPLELVNVVLQDAKGDLQGVVSTADGLYQFSRIEPGAYVLKASFVGYEVFTDSLSLDPGEDRSLNIELEATTAAMDDILVQAERGGGAARVTAGQQTIVPRDIELVPTPDVSGDLAGYLATLPGIVSTGDRGGQFFIRGGEPSQNLVLMDGMLIYQPFHLLGFYSVFPSEILSRVDVHAGGYGSRYGERISSVIDVASRSGHQRRIMGSAAASPFMSSLLLEGPIVPGRISVLASVRKSVVEDGASRIVNHPLPFDFGDVFAKVNAEVGARSRLSVTALSTFDRGRLYEGNELVLPEDVHWENQAIGLRFLTLPRILSMSAEIIFNHSRYKSELGPPDDPDRFTSISNTLLGLHATYPGDRVNVETGLAFRAISPRTELGGLYQNVERRSQEINHFALYAEPEFIVGHLRARIGARLEFYHVQYEPVLEPRLRLVWERGIHRLSAAAGIFHQEIVGIVDQRDAASVFTAWMNIPSGRASLDVTGVPRALHLIAGYGISPGPGVELSVEGFYKNLDHLFVPEWTPYPEMTTRLQPATGRSGGVDGRIEIRKGTFYAYVSYGFSSTRYTSRQATLPLWFGDDELTYRPPHDRTHQATALLSGEIFGFDVSARWTFGSGLPFSRPAGFDGYVPLNSTEIRPDAPRFRRALYERPFNAELPTYHRLDLSVERAVDLGPVRLTAQGSIINLYDRSNIFYVDVFTLRRVDQLPFLPSLGLKVEVNGEN